MIRLSFQTIDPLDAVTRVLDHARRAAFEPQEMHLQPNLAGGYTVSLALGAAPVISFQTLTDQLRRIVTVQTLTVVGATG